MSSRLFVKNLPKHLNSERLRQVFEKAGAKVTDSKVITKDGKSRQIGYVGVQDESQAAKMIEALNNTFIDTSWIELAYAKDQKDPDLPKSISKHS